MCSLFVYALSRILAARAWSSSIIFFDFFTSSLSLVTQTSKSRFWRSNVRGEICFCFNNFCILFSSLLCLKAIAYSLSLIISGKFWMFNSSTDVNPCFSINSLNVFLAKIERLVLASGSTSSLTGKFK